MPLLSPTQELWQEEREEKALSKGLRGGIEALLEVRFGEEGLALMPRVRQIADPDTLEQLLHASKSAPDLDALRALLPPQA